MPDNFLSRNVGSDRFVGVDPIGSSAVMNRRPPTARHRRTFSDAVSIVRGSMCGPLCPRTVGGTPGERKLAFHRPCLDVDDVWQQRAGAKRGGAGAQLAPRNGAPKLNTPPSEATSQ